MFRMMILLLLASVSVLRAQPTNDAIASQLADSLARKLATSTDTLRIRSLENDPQLIILQALAKRKPTKLIDDIKNENCLILSPAIFTVQYSPIGKNKFQRSITLSLSTQKVESGVLSIPIEHNFSHLDTLGRTELLQINASSSSYLRAAVPDEPFSWAGDLLRPVVIFATLAATVWLFFSVRSR